ncbi:TatD family hydrolase [Candidatus Woesearchaeota archaeon]|jgi:TatD DNase family protein|nr:TatD family hydrolase [Candidatus Woesearchaeota archaeon]MBT4248104.1 TatD family hydrolase [Candidatus Woesearchaeota archaeon]
MLVDAHCHIDLCKSSAQEVVSGEVIIITNGVDLKSNKKVLSYAKIFPNVRAALGLYPTHAIDASVEDLVEVIKFIEQNKKKIVAIGEVGIDFYHITDAKEMKKEVAAFKKMITLANKINKPLIVHSRKATDAALDVLKTAKVPVIMHCFDGNELQTHEAMKRGYYFTIPANFWTRKGFKKTARRVPIDRLLTETDSPYLSPIEGENRSENVRYAIEKLAELKDMTYRKVEDQIYQNFMKIFNK